MSRRESTSVPSRSHKMVVVVMISLRAPSLLFHVPIKALHSGHRFPLQAGGYRRRHGIRRQLQLQQRRGIPTMAARCGGTYLFVTIAADWRTAGYAIGI